MNNIAYLPNKQGHYKQDCSNCLYCDKCPDACKVIKCDWDLDCEDDRLDGEIDRVVLSVYDY